MSDIEVMIAYLMLKVRQRDWHGVADAAMDIREMEAEAKVIKECARFVDDYVSDAAGIHYDTGNELKKHFGFEEKNNGHT